MAVFLRGSWAPPDRNLVALYADAGLTYKGLLPSRSNDVFGIAFALAKISDDIRALDRDIRQFSGTNVPLHDYEATLEFTYQHMNGNQLIAPAAAKFILSRSF